MLLIKNAMIEERYRKPYKQEKYMSQNSMSHLQTMEGSKIEPGYQKVFTVWGDLGLEDLLEMVITSYLL